MTTEETERNKSASKRRGEANVGTGPIIKPEGKRQQYNLKPIRTVARGED
jgi:hypothetical protein